MKEVQWFIGLSECYRTFLKAFGRTSRPVLDLFRNDTSQWGEEQTKEFWQLQKSLMTAPVLAIPRIGSPFTITSDSSNFSVGTTMEHEVHPVDFSSHRLTDTDTRRHTGNQELLDFLIGLQKWGLYLRGFIFSLRTNNEPIIFLQTRSNLSPRQRRWLEIFNRSYFEIEHIKRAKILLLIC